MTPCRTAGKQRPDRRGDSRSQPGSARWRVVRHVALLSVLVGVISLLWDREHAVASMVARPALAGLGMATVRLAKSTGRIAGSVLAVALFGYVAICLYLYVFQSRFVYFPSDELVITPSDLGMDYRDVWIESANGAMMHAWIVPAVDSRGVVLYCHGNGGNVSYTTDLIGVFHQLGFSTLVFDYQGYGRSEGSPSEGNTRADAAAAWRYLVEDEGIPPHRIIAFGRSLGGAVASRLAVDHTPAVLVLDSAFTSLPDMARHLYPIMPVRWLARFEYATVDYVRQVNCPVIVIHSEDDRLVPISHGREIFRAAGEPKRFITTRGGHNAVVEATGSLYARELEKALQELSFQE